MGRSKNRKMVFKQFTVLDDRCAMKIGTDAVVLGVVANHANPAKILDIGTGSGIVALMLAQRFPDSNVTAIEIEQEAFSQACENIKASPFKISCFHESFQDYTLRDELKFDWYASLLLFYVDKNGKFKDLAHERRYHNFSTVG